MWPNAWKTADLVIFSEEILNGKLHFLCSVKIKVLLKSSNFVRHFFLIINQIINNYTSLISYYYGVSWLSLFLGYLQEFPFGCICIYNQKTQAHSFCLNVINWKKNYTAMWMYIDIDYLWKSCYHLLIKGFHLIFHSIEKCVTQSIIH